MFLGFTANIIIINYVEDISKSWRILTSTVLIPTIPLLVLIYLMPGRLLALSMSATGTANKNRITEVPDETRLLSLNPSTWARKLSIRAHQSDQ